MKMFFSLVTAAVLALCAVITPVFAEDKTVSKQAPTLNNRFYFDQLYSNEKTLYDRILGAIENGNASVYFADLDLDHDSTVRVYEALRKDSYEFNQINMFGDGWYWIVIYEERMIMHIDYNANDPASRAARMEFEDKAALIVEEANKQPTDYEKLKYIHDWIADNTVYLDDDTKDEIRTADGPILSGIALCSGYTRAFQYLAQSLGFDCIYVSGIGNTISHAWNMVELDGEWYNVDVTWDDGDTVNYAYFLKGEKTFTASGTEHIPDSGFTYPEAHLDYDPPKSVFSVVLTIIRVLVCGAFVVFIFLFHRKR